MMIQRTKCLVVLLTISIGMTGCTSGASQAEEATPTPIPMPIVPTSPTYEVQRGEVVDELQVSGRIAPTVEEELFFRTAGYVGAVFVDADDWVEEGDLLAELETTDLQNQLAQAQVELEAAQLSNARLVAETEANLEIAELRLAQARALMPGLTAAEIALQQATRAEADAAYEYEKAVNRPWEWQYDDVKKVYTDAWQNAKDNLALAQANYDAAVAEQYASSLELTILETKVELARMRLEEIQVGLDLQSMELVVKRLDDQLADTRIVAPFDGQVLLASLSKGRSVDARRKVIVVVQPDELEVSVDIQDRLDLEKLAEGMPVTIEPVNRPGEELKGHIRRLPYPYGGGGSTGGGIEDEDRSTRIALDTAAGAAGFKIGDRVRVTIVLERKDDVLWLPPQAIRTFEGRKFVVVQDGQAQVRVDVKIGIEGEERVEIEKGLTEGQVVMGQ